LKALQLVPENSCVCFLMTYTWYITVLSRCLFVQLCCHSVCVTCWIRFLYDRIAGCAYL